MGTRTPFDKDYYGVMGLHPEATDEEIRKAYRRLALQWHPDRNSGDPQATERFREISEAYAVLISPIRRREYETARRSGATTRFGARREDLFRDLFSDPGASAIFDELARELGRMGMRADRQFFHQTLFGGRVVVTGGIFVISPVAPVIAALRLARAAFRRSDAVTPVPSVSSRPRAPGLLQGLGRWIRALVAGSAGEGAPAISTVDDLVQPLRLRQREAARGGRKRVTLRGDDGVEDVLVSIPRGVQAGTRLRLRGKGRRRSDGRGDAYLVVEIDERH